MNVENVCFFCTCIYVHMHMFDNDIDIFSYNTSWNVPNHSNQQIGGIHRALNGWYGQVPPSLQHGNRRHETSRTPERRFEAGLQWPQTPAGQCLMNFLVLSAWCGVYPFTGLYRHMRISRITSLNCISFLVVGWPVLLIRRVKLNGPGALEEWFMAIQKCSGVPTTSLESIVDSHQWRKHPC